MSVVHSLDIWAVSSQRRNRIVYRIRPGITWDDFVVRMNDYFGSKWDPYIVSYGPVADQEWWRFGPFEKTELKVVVVDEWH